MKIDFHTHGRLAKYLPFSIEYTNKLLDDAIANGLDAICLTEHFNTIEFGSIYDYMLESFEQVGDVFLYKGLKIFPGMEIDASEGGHMLVIGSYEEILQLNKELDNNKEKGGFLSASEVLDRIDKYSMISGIAHPHREGCKIYTLSEEVLSRFQFVDMNGKDVYMYGREVVEEQVIALGREIDAYVVAGSDTHQSFQYGCVYNEFEKDCNTVKELKNEIKNKSYEIYIAQNLTLKVNIASAIKKALKEIHALGGDYIAVYQNMFTR